MVSESSVLKELFLDLEGNKVSEKKDADYAKIETLMGSFGKEKLAQALEGLNVFDALMRDMTGDSIIIAMHSLSVFCTVFEVKPEIVKRPEALLRSVVSLLQTNVSVPKASELVVKALKCISLICPSVKSVGKEGNTIKSILLRCMVDSENSNGIDVKLHALFLLKSLLQSKLMEFTDTSNWLKVLFNLIFDENASIRDAALQATYFFKHKLSGNEEYLDVLANNLVPSKFSKMLIEMIMHDRNWAVIWRLLVEILGKRLHTSSSLVNSLLAVEERAFKTSNVETKKEAFNCWNSLLHNFALEQSVLSSDRRVKLLTIPLRANNCRNGDVALVKLNVWWNIIRLMKSDVSNFSEMVLTPFLCFCYGGLNESVSNGSGRLNSSNAGEACAKLYPVLSIPSLHCLCEILTRSAQYPLPDELVKDLAIQPLEDPPIVSQKTFCSLSRLLTQCLGEAVNLEGHDARQMPYVIHSWNALLKLISLGCDEPLYNGDAVSKDQKTIAMVKELLRLLANLVESAASYDGRTTAVFVSMVENMVSGAYAFPPYVLNSHALGVGSLMVMNSFPSLYLSTLLMTPAFATDKELHPRIKDVFSKLIHTGCSNISPLPFARSLLKRMEKDASEQPPNVIIPYFQELWVLIANHLSDIIDKEGSVSEGNGAGHDFHCMYGMLMLPIGYCLKAEMSQEILEPALKSWGRLFELFVINAQLVVTTQSHEIVEELCRKILSLCKKGAKSWACLGNCIQFILLMYQKPYFDSLWKEYSKKVSKGEKTNGLPFSQQLLVLLTSKIAAGFSNTSELSIDIQDNASRHKTIMHYFILVFTSSTSFSTMNIVNVEKGIQCISFYLNLTANLQENQPLRNEMIPLWDKFLHFLEKFLPSCTSKTQALVDSLSPLFLEAFKHPLTGIVDRTKISWNGSLGQYLSSADIPKSLSDILDDALKDMSGSEDLMGNMVSKDTQKSVFALPERRRGKGKAKTTPPPKSKDVHHNTMPSENSVEFKVIPSKPKSSVLTDHQKEIMKERRVDIPALYQDLTQDSVSQSFSQESQAVVVVKSASSAMTEEDANPPFSQTLQAEMKSGAEKSVSESDKNLTFKLPSPEIPKPSQKRSSTRSSPASEPKEMAKAVISSPGESENQADNGCGVNDAPKNVPITRRKGRKRKQCLIGLNNVDISPVVIDSGDDKVLEKSSTATSSDSKKMDKSSDINAEPLPVDETGDGAMLTGQPILSGNNDSGSELTAEALGSTANSLKLLLRKDKEDNGLKDTIKVASVSKTHNSSTKGVGASDSLKIVSKKSTTGTPSSLDSDSGEQSVTDADGRGSKDGNVGSSVSETQVSKALSKSANAAYSDHGAPGTEDEDKMGLTYVKISAPRKLSDVEFSNFQTNLVVSDHCTTSNDTPSVSFDSPSSKSPSKVSSKLRAFPASPKSKSLGNSPSLDKWVIVTKRDHEDKSPVKSPSKPASLDGGSKNIPVILLDSDGDDVSDAVEVMKADEMYVFSNSEDLVDSSQDPMDSPSIQLKGPVKKCSINLSRVSDILPEEVAFIQYEGRTVKCNMSPMKEGKADEETKKVGQVNSPVVSNLFSPRNSRGARILNLAQGNKSGADENPESPVRDAANRVVLQNSDSNLQNSPLSHLRSFDVNNSTPPTKKPRRIRPMHIGNVSPQYKAVDIGCVASEGDIPVHNYSPNASPGGSVMKRKKSCGEDSISPLSKKSRRVSFADPIVSRQVEFRVPESERYFKKNKTSVNRCLKLTGVSSDTLQPSASDDDDNDEDDDLEVISKASTDGIVSSLPSVQTEMSGTEEYDEMPVLSPCGKPATGAEKIQETSDTDAGSSLDAVEVVDLEEDCAKSTGKKDEAGIVLPNDKESKIPELPSVESVAPSSHITVKGRPSTDTEPKDREMEVELIDANPPQPAGSESCANGDVPEEPLLSSQGDSKGDDRLSKNLENTGKVSTNSHIPASKQDSSTDISDDSDKTVSSDIGAPAEFLSNSISSSHQSLDSPKTSDSSEPSVLESDVEDPRTDKLNTQEEIYPPLRDCQDSVVLIIDKLTTKLWKERCRQSLEKKKILTIGDLSRLTEEFIERIPFKAPKWKNVKAELEEYYANLPETNKTCEAAESSGDGQLAAMEVDEGANSDLQKFRETLSKMSAKDILKELRAVNLAEAVFQEMNDENTSAIDQTVPLTKRQTRSDRMSKPSASAKSFESISVQVSEFEVLSELQLIAKKKGPNPDDSASVSSQVSERDLLPAKSGASCPNESKSPVASKVFQSTSTNVTVSELEAFVGKPVEEPKTLTSIAVQVSDGEILSRIGSYEVLLQVYGRSDFKDAVGELSSEKLMQLLKLVVRVAHEKGQMFDGSVDLIAKRILLCVVKELMNDNELADTVKVIMWIFKNTLFTKEYIKVIPSILSGVKEDVISELILKHESIMESIQSKLPASKGLKMAVDVLEQKNITLLPEEEIDRLNDILDNHRTCGELFDRYTRIIKERISGNIPH